MVLIDVNILIYAFQITSPNHSAYRAWLTGIIRSDQAFGVSDLVLSGFIRIVTHPNIFDPPDNLDTALAFVDGIRSRPSYVAVNPGPRHWEIFVRLCKEGGARGNLFSDAYLAALAIESGSELITADRDFARFPGLRWRYPLS